MAALGNIYLLAFLIKLHFRFQVYNLNLLQKYSTLLLY